MNHLKWLLRTPKRAIGHGFELETRIYQRHFVKCQSELTPSRKTKATKDLNQMTIYKSCVWIRKTNRLRERERGRERESSRAPRESDFKNGYAVWHIDVHELCAFVRPQWFVAPPNETTCRFSAQFRFWIQICFRLDTVSLFATLNNSSNKNRIENCLTPKWKAQTHMHRTSERSKEKDSLCDVLFIVVVFHFGVCGFVPWNRVGNTIRMNAATYIWWKFLHHDFRNRYDFHSCCTTIRFSF